MPPHRTRSFTSRPSPTSLSANADPAGTSEVNVIVASRLLAHVRARRAAGTLDPVVLIVGSGEQYGRHELSEMPLGESAAQQPMGVYAASKAAQEVLALEAYRTGGVRVIAVRPFNHTGPGQSPNFVIPALVRRAVALRGTSKPLVMGNTETVRDFSHVEDVARAYVALAESGTPGEAYNIASGSGDQHGGARASHPCPRRRRREIAVGSRARSPRGCAGARGKRREAARGNRLGSASLARLHSRRAHPCRVALTYRRSCSLARARS